MKNTPVYIAELKRDGAMNALRAAAIRDLTELREIIKYLIAKPPKTSAGLNYVRDRVDLIGDYLNEAAKLKGGEAEIEEPVSGIPDPEPGV